MAALFFLLALVVLTAHGERRADAAAPQPPDAPPGAPPLPLSASGVLGAALIPPTPSAYDGAVRVAVSGPAGARAPTPS